MITGEYQGVLYEDLPATYEGAGVCVRFRAATQADIIAMLNDIDCLVRNMVASEPDPETGEVTWTHDGTYKDRDPSVPGEPRGVFGCDISWIGQTVVTKATYDSNGVELTPAVLSPQYHVNVLFTGPKLTEESPFTEGEKRLIELLVLWKEAGEVDGVVNVSELSTVFSATGIVDPSTFATPVNGY